MSIEIEKRVNVKIRVNSNNHELCDTKCPYYRMNGEYYECSRYNATLLFTQINPENFRVEIELHRHHECISEFSLPLTRDEFKKKFTPELWYLATTYVAWSEEGFYDNMVLGFRDSRKEEYTHKVNIIRELLSAGIIKKENIGE